MMGVALDRYLSGRNAMLANEIYEKIHFIPICFLICFNSFLNFGFLKS